jgi:hypothetical protein
MPEFLILIAIGLSCIVIFFKTIWESVGDSNAENFEERINEMRDKGIISDEEFKRVGKNIPEIGLGKYREKYRYL